MRSTFGPTCCSMEVLRSFIAFVLSTCCAGIFRADRGEECFPQNRRVDPQRLRVDICQAKPQLFWRNLFEIVSIGISTPAEDFSLVSKPYRGKVCDARSDREQPSLLSCVQRHRPCDLRPRSHETHIAAEDVDELRQFVQLVAPQHRANPRDTWIPRGSR